MKKNKKISEANPERKTPKAKPKNKDKIVVPKFDIKASTAW